MKKLPVLSVAILSAIIISAALLAQAATKTIDGVVSDTMCGRNHMEPGKTDAECIQECMKGKVSYALVAGSNIYTLAGQPRTIAAFAGKHVHVEGEIKDKTLTVKSIHDMKSEMKPGMDM